MANWIPRIQYGGGPTTINFTYPPEGDPENEVLRGDVRVSQSNSGNEQVQWNYTEEIWTINFVFLSQTELDNLRTFFTSHAVKGNTFTYFPSNDEATNFTMSLADHNFRPKRVFSDGSGDFIYEVSIQMRRVYT